LKQDAVFKFGEGSNVFNEDQNNGKTGLFVLGASQPSSNPIPSPGGPGADPVTWRRSPLFSQKPGGADYISHESKEADFNQQADGLIKAEPPSDQLQSVPNFVSVF